MQPTLISVPTRWLSICNRRLLTTLLSPMPRKRTPRRLVIWISPRRFIRWHLTGGGSSSIIDAAGLTSGNSHDRAFQITGSAVTVIFQDLAIRNGQAADAGASGASTNPTAQNSIRAGGCILNGAGIDINQVAVIGGGSVTLDNVTIQSCQVLGKGDDIVNEHRELEAWGGASPVSERRATSSLRIAR